MPPTVTLTIGELAERSGVSTSALRFYEQQGLIGSQRTAGNQRRYTRGTLRRVSIIRAAQRVGLTLEEVGTALSTLPVGREASQRDWERMSRSWRAQLEERIAALQQLRDELDSCIGCGCLSLQRCRLFNPEDAAAKLGQGPRYLLGDTSAEAMAQSDA